MSKLQLTLVVVVGVLALGSLAQSHLATRASQEVAELLSLDSTPIYYQTRRVASQNRETEANLLSVGGFYREAIQAYRTALEIDPANEEARVGYEEATVLQLLNTPDQISTDPQALRYHAVRIQARPTRWIDSAAATVARGNLAFFVDGDPVRADELYNEVLRTDPNHLAARVGLTATLLSRASKPVEGLLESLVDLANAGKPNRFQCETIARLALLNDQQEALLTWAEKAAALERTVGAVTLLAQAKLRSPRPDEAAPEGAELVRRDPKSPVGHQILCQAYAKSNNQEMTIEACSDAFSLDNDPRTLLNLARALGTVGRVKEAVEAYREVLRRDEGQPVATYELGALLLRVGDVKNGATLLTRVANLAAPPGSDLPPEMARLRDDAVRLLQALPPPPPEASDEGARPPARK